MAHSGGDFGHHPKNIRLRLAEQRAEWHLELLRLSQSIYGSTHYDRREPRLQRAEVAVLAHAGACRLASVQGYIACPCDQGSQLAENVETAMRPLGEVQGFFCAKQPFNKTVEFLT